MVTTVKDCSGYTLLEVMIAAAILTVVSLPLLYFMHTALLKDSPDQLLAACMLATDCMERTLLTRNFGDMNLDTLTANGAYSIERRITCDGSLGQVLIEVGKSKDEPMVKLMRYVQLQEAKK